MTDMMHLLFISNDSYIPHVATALASIFENNKEMRFAIHLLVTDISEEKRLKLTNFVAGYQSTLDIREVRPEQLEIDLSVCGKWGIFPSLKLYAGDFFPDVDRLLYMDADMICIGSLKGLQDVDISRYVIAMSPDEEGCWKHKERLEMPSSAFYGCAGLVYFNLKRWREEQWRQKCFAYFNDSANRDIIQWGEQDVLNKVCMGHILPLPYEYNMFASYYVHHRRVVPKEMMDQLQAHKDHAVVIHYIDACKPWHQDNLFPLRRYYWQYHRLTPWKGETYGCSPVYEGAYIHLKSRIKQCLHRLGLREDEYGYDCR